MAVDFSGFPRARRKSLSHCTTRFSSYRRPSEPFGIAVPTCGFQSTPSILRTSGACLRGSPDRFKPLSCNAGHDFAFLFDDKGFQPSISRFSEPMLLGALQPTDTGVSRDFIAF